MTRFDLIFAGVAVAALAAGCATSNTRGTGDDVDKQATASPNPGNDRAIGPKKTITDPNAIRDMVRQPGLQVGRTM
jgi:predicted small secreted protein